MICLCSYDCTSRRDVVTAAPQRGTCRERRGRCQGGVGLASAAEENQESSQRLAGFQTGSGQTGFPQKGHESLHLAVFCFARAHMLPHFAIFLPAFSRER